MARKKKSKRNMLGVFLTVVFLVLVIGALIVWLMGFVMRSFPVDKMEIVKDSVNFEWTNDCQKIQQKTPDYFCVTGRVRNNHSKTAYGVKLRFNIYETSLKKELKDTRRISYCLPEVPPNGVREFSCIVLSTQRDDKVGDYGADVQIDEAMDKGQAIVYGILDKFLCQKFGLCRFW